jgi:UDP-glucose 4-epimerase
VTAPDDGVSGGIDPPEALTDREILVTGGAGFVGSHVAEALAHVARVTVLDDCSSGHPEYVPEAATLVEADLRDTAAVSDAVAGVDVVFHQAALVSVTASVEEPLRSHSVNVAGTLELLDAARRADARVVLASSAAVYGHPEAVPVAETATPEPTSPYGVDKLAVDHYARVFADRYGLPAVPLRYFNVYGPRSSGAYSGVIDVFLEQARDGGPLTVHGDGSQTRDFVHVSDVVRANLLAATTEHTGTAFNVGTGEAVSVADLAETVAALVDTDPAVSYTDPRPGDIERSCADTTRARERLGFESTVDLREGLAGLVAP